MLSRRNACERATHQAMPEPMLKPNAAYQSHSGIIASLPAVSAYRSCLCARLFATRLRSGAVLSLQGLAVSPYSHTPLARSPMDQQYPCCRPRNSSSVRRRVQYPCNYGWLSLDIGEVVIAARRNLALHHIAGRLVFIVSVQLISTPVPCTVAVTLVGGTGTAGQGPGPGPGPDAPHCAATSAGKRAPLSTAWIRPCIFHGQSGVLVTWRPTTSKHTPGATDASCLPPRACSRVSPRGCSYTPSRHPGTAQAHAPPR